MARSFLNEFPRISSVSLFLENKKGQRWDLNSEAEKQAVIDAYNLIQEGRGTQDYGWDACANVDCGMGASCKFGQCFCAADVENDQCIKSPDDCAGYTCSGNGFCAAGTCACDDG